MTLDQPEYTDELKIPKDRVAILIGKAGSAKKDIERATQTRLEIDSEEGDVTIRGKDTILLFSAREIIRAIGRGFNPDIARLLLKQDYSFETLPLSEYLGKSKKRMMRVKSRIIGEDGRARRTIEELTETHIRVYGKTIGIIGPLERVLMAKQAVEMLFSGSTHATVYKWLERKHRSFRQL
ncbi:RNA-processing protein [Candidatus Woesearchaeota archaeon]|nr:RNA-processing protein [Candidatus Woesearchaeota archaeon]